MPFSSGLVRGVLGEGGPRAVEGAVSTEQYRKNEVGRGTQSASMNDAEWYVFRGIYRLHAFPAKQHFSLAGENQRPLTREEASALAF